MFRRILTVFYVVTIAMAAFASVGGKAYAQTEPTAIIDAAFKDLSAKLGMSLSRTQPSNSTYTWEQTNFGSPALGCPTPGMNYAQVMTNGYKIVITVNGTAYDYRANADGSVLFQCTGSGAATVSPGGTVSTTTPNAAPASQPKTYTNPLAYIGSDRNVYVMQLGGTQGSVAFTTDASGASMASYPYLQTRSAYSSLRWSPDGLALAFIGGNVTAPPSLYVARSGQVPQIIARGVSNLFPPFWLPNSQEIGFLVSAGATDPTTQASKFQIQAIPVGGGSPRVLGEISYVHQSGTPVSVAVDDLAYFFETGLYGNGAIFANTKSGGYVFTTNGSNIGLGFTTGMGVIWQRSDLGRAALSPDGTQLIALRFDPTKLTIGGMQTPLSLEKVDLATGKSVTLVTQPGVDQIGWADNNTILYSTLTAPKALNITVTLTAATAEMLSLPLLPPYGLNSYTVTLWKMPNTGGNAVSLNTASGRGIGIMGGTPDDASAIYSFVPSIEAAINALNGNPNISLAAIQQIAPFPSIMTVSLGGQNAAKIIGGGRPSSVVGTFSAVGAPSITAPTTQPAANQPPPALVIGGQAVVSVTGDALNLRASPTKGASVVRLLKAGVVVTVVGGPANADGLRWWQIKVADGTTGWAADQVTDNSGTTNTLTPQ